MEHVEIMDKRTILRDVMMDTLNKCEKDAELYRSVCNSRKGTEIIYTKQLVEIEDGRKALKSCGVYNEKAFTIAERFKSLKVAVLNFANDTHPGGGCIYGASAQEEDLCRCSTLYPALISPKNIEGFYKKHKDNNKIGSGDIIYTPNITVFKNDSYKLTIEPYQVDIITCAAPNMAGEKIGRRKRRFLYKILKTRIEKIFLVAIKNNVDVLVLGAWGCGVFNNNPYDVAKIMMTMAHKYKKYFTNIEFAVYDPSEDKKTYGAFIEMHEYAVFKDLL